MERTRVFSDQSSNASYNGWSKYQDVIVDSWTFTYVKEKLYSIMDDVVTEEFFKKRKNGEILQNPLLQLNQGFVRPYVAVVHSKGTDGALYENLRIRDFTDPKYLTLYDRLSANALLDNEFSDIREECITKAWSKVDQSELLALASAGEAPETVKWIISIFKRLLTATKLLKGKLSKREVKELKKSLASIDSVSSAWLEFRYAIRPLFFEVQAALSALDKIIKAKTRFRALAKSEDSSPVVESINYFTPAGGLVVKFTNRHTESHSYVCKAGVLYTVADDINSALSVWGLDQPLESIWELVPFSFIIDWFLNIGDILSSWSVSSSLKPLTSWVTEQYTWKYKVETIGFQRLSEIPDRFSNISCYLDTSPIVTGTVMVKRRIPSPPLPITPHVDLNLDLLKLVDICFILRQLLK